MKNPLNVSFSGGRTSAYMTKQILDNWSDRYDIVVTFANTGREDSRTLDFVHQCDVQLGFNTVWLEAVVNEGRHASTHRVVSYETASRNGEPFEAAIRKYGIPNQTFQMCNRELKLNPMKSYRASVGMGPGTLTAIGIRADEPRRVNEKAAEMSIVYPLVHTWPVDKQDVLEWWAGQSFDLGIGEFEGNCKGCFKKSYHKHFQQIDKDPSVYDWTRDMEDKYRHLGPQVGPRVMFRGRLDTRGLFALHEDFKRNGPTAMRRIPIHENGGCTESCEPFAMQHELEFA